ncbi:MAG: GNAT family N-acetyltransferase [Bacteroidota bacterium]
MKIVRLFNEVLENYQFKIADPESAEKLTEFWKQSFEEAYHDIHSATDILAYSARNFTNEAATRLLSDDNCTCTFAMKAGKVVGLSVIIKNDCPGRSHLAASELKQLYLLSSEYGTGLGKAMMEDSIRKTRESGSSHLWLCVSNLNFRAFRFYQKFGFTKIGNGPMLEVGLDRLLSSIMIREV